MPHLGDELRHSGCNVCSSSLGPQDLRGDKLVLTCLLSDRVYIVDISKEAPALQKTIQAESLYKLGLATPHTYHFFPSGEVMISTLGKPDGSGQGSFLILDIAQDFAVRGKGVVHLYFSFG